MSYRVPHSTTDTPKTQGIKTSTTALAANAKRRYWQIQNQHTTILYIKFGAGATTSDFDIALKGGTGAKDGLGASYEQEFVVYTGVISVVASSGDPSYSIIEL